MEILPHQPWLGALLSDGLAVGSTSKEKSDKLIFINLIVINLRFPQGALGENSPSVCDMGMTGEQQNHLDTYLPKKMTLASKKMGRGEEKIIGTLQSIFIPLSLW